jgi:small subunit ribosomal protein S16
MVKIRLTRGGAKKRPHYRIIAIDHHRQREGLPLEYLGTYDPAAESFGGGAGTARPQAGRGGGRLRWPARAERSG